MNGNQRLANMFFTPVILPNNHSSHIERPDHWLASLMLASGSIGLIERMKLLFYALLMISILGIGCQDDEPTPTKREIHHVFFEEPPMVYYTHPVEINMNGDSLFDFVITVGLEYSGGAAHTKFIVNSLRDARVKLLDTHAVAFNENFAVGPDNDLDNILWNITSGELLVRTDQENVPPVWSGQWHDKQEAYLAVNFKHEGKLHYGWIKLLADEEHNGILVLEHAYHTRPEMIIKTGQIE